MFWAAERNIQQLLPACDDISLSPPPISFLRMGFVAAGAQNLKFLVAINSVFLEVFFSVRQRSDSNSDRSEQNYYQYYILCTMYP